MKKRVELSVRELVEFVLLSGSIDNRIAGADRMAEGARIHRLVQKAAGENYTPEVALSHSDMVGDFEFFVRGRADGIIVEEKGIVVDEIKSTTRELSDFDEGATPVHLAQAKCYAYFYACDHELSTIGVRMTYYQVDTKEIRYLDEDYSFAALRDFYFDLLAAYQEFAALRAHWQTQRDASIAALSFPFAAYRAGQREMAVTVFNAIKREVDVFISAPTGIGKTLSVLFPTIKALGDDYLTKAFYLTAKTVTKGVAEEGVALLAAQGLRLKSLVITAKEKMCFLDEPKCNPEDCPYAVDYYSKLQDAVTDALVSYDHFSQGVIAEIAEKHQLCPFEFSLELALYAELIICDYNYLYDPKVALARFFEEGPQDFAFLVDEAHNLVDRARGMFSKELKKSEVLALMRSLDKKQDRIYKPLSRINAALLALRKAQDNAPFLARQEALTELAEELSYFCYAFEDWRKAHPEHPAGEAALDLYFALRDYLRIAELYDDHFITTISVYRSEVVVKILCLDPSKCLAARTALGRSGIFFSATLAPMDYYKNLLGETQAANYRLPSPYDSSRLGILMADGISTKYLHREDSKEEVARMIAAFVAGRVGNYLVYFPSYTYLQMVYEEFVGLSPQAETIVQVTGMDEEARRDFLACFDEVGETTLVGFCVLGGIYGEGIDLRGDRLIGTVIVGVGLPMVNDETKLLRDYFNDHGVSGFDYAYKYPGMNRVLQAMGRVIRGEDDRGLVLLIDSRFAGAEYRDLFPRHLAHYICVHSEEEVGEAAENFWKSYERH